MHVLYTRGLPEMNDVFWRTRTGRRPSRSKPSPARTSPARPQTAHAAATSPTTRTSGGAATDKTPRSIRYTASFKAGKAGKYLLLAAASGGDHYKVSVDGKQVLEQTQAEGQVPESASLDLTAGQTVTRRRRLSARLRPAIRFGLGIVNEADMISPR